MCGIAAVLLRRDGNEQSSQKKASVSAAAELCEALSILQHRGQDAAGIVTCAEKGRLFQRKANGMVRDVFAPGRVAPIGLPGYMGLAHVRYPTAGTASASEAQPFYVNHPYGLCLAHNGNLVNAVELRDYLDRTALRHINSDSDSEVLLNLLADSLLHSTLGKPRIDAVSEIFAAVSEVMRRCSGGFACVAMIPAVGILAFRDPHGIRPCVYGRRPSSSRSDWMVASESAALSALGYSEITDLPPAHAILIPRSYNKLMNDGANDYNSGSAYEISCEGAPEIIVRNLMPPTAVAPLFTPCIFEYVYFARQDSIMDGVSVYDARCAMGEALGKHIVGSRGRDHGIDVVIPVPDTSRVGAIETARILGVPYREGFSKNRYIGRTFIMPGQEARIAGVQRKMNAMPPEFVGKRVLLVDDSIVRGTTSREIVIMARRAGAISVDFASCSPPVRHVNVYGIDIPTRKELVANGRTEKEVAECIGADAVHYLPLEALVDCVRKQNSSISRFETSVFDGVYITGDVTDKHIASLEARRGEAAANAAATAVAAASAAASAAAAALAAASKAADSNLSAALQAGTSSASLQAREANSSPVNFE